MATASTATAAAANRAAVQVDPPGAAWSGARASAAQGGPNDVQQDQRNAIMTRCCNYGAGIADVLVDLMQLAKH